MPKLTVVFEYPDDDELKHAMRLFENGHGGENIAHVEPYDAVDRCNNFRAILEENGQTNADHLVN